MESHRCSSSTRRPPAFDLMCERLCVEHTHTATTKQALPKQTISLLLKKIKPSEIAPVVMVSSFPKRKRQHPLPGSSSSSSSNVPVFQPTRSTQSSQSKHSLNIHDLDAIKKKVRWRPREQTSQMITTGFAFFRFQTVKDEVLPPVPQQPPEIKIKK